MKLHLMHKVLKGKMKVHKMVHVCVIFLLHLSTIELTLILLKNHMKNRIISSLKL